MPMTNASAAAPPSAVSRRRAMARRRSAASRPLVFLDASMRKEGIGA
jgi:hypothetical protein